MSTSMIPFNRTTGPTVESLQREIYERNRELSDTQEELRQERLKTATMERGIQQLRTILGPLYGALQMVHGEIDAMGIGGGSYSGDSPSPSPATDPRIAKVWDSWKSKLGEGPAKIIDALLLHREMNTQQLAIATGYHRTTVPAFVHKLTKAGLINKNSGRFSLKEI